MTSEAERQEQTDGINSAALDTGGCDIKHGDLAEHARTDMTEELSSSEISPFSKPICQPALGFKKIAAEEMGGTDNVSHLTA